MAIDLYLTSFDIKIVSFLFLSTVFAIINLSWMFLFVTSIRSYLRTPLITVKETHAIYHVSRHLPFVSIIVPARNEQDNIERCILSLLAQDYPSFEVIVVDDNSTDNTLRIVKDIKSRVKGLSEDSSSSIHRLKIITITEKPVKWTGKTWASEQGYLQSAGNVLLFTDADTYYMSKDTISQTVSYMQKENLDVLTGLPFIELRDFWSKVTMPLWNHFSILLGANTGAMNNPKSKVAYLMGSFFLIRRKVIEEVGTFRSVRNAIQEDRELGMRIKQAGYNMKIVRIDNAVSALWSRDLLTLWHGIGRTFAPMTKLQIFTSLITVFSMTMLPFLLLPSALLLGAYTGTSDLNLLFWMVDVSSTFQQQELEQLTVLFFYLNVISCLMIVIAVAVKDMRKYRITPVYSLLSFLGAGFIVISYIANLISLLSEQSISWRGRTSKITYSNKL
ncbi:MAG TPA: glycosyltransferase [Nitrososphaeraceae archaeon]|nr:glycosyltransferase [Nitrososphaeraceae archaeon]